MSYSKSPRMRELKLKRLKAEMNQVRENRRHIKKMRDLGASNREIAIALGIPEDSPLLAPQP